MSAYDHDDCGPAIGEDAIYLNNAATSWPKPVCVAEAVRESLIAKPGSAHRGGIMDFDVFEAVRARLAALFGIGDSSRISLGSNATWGLNLAFFGIPFERGDTIITTKAEHNSVLRPVHALERRGLVRAVYLDVDAQGRVQPDAWAQALDVHEPRLAAFTHASNVTGAVNDAARLSALAHERGALVLLDASQSAGWVDVEPERWGVDLMTFTGHKYLLGPQGTGGLYVREGLELAPYLVGGTGILSDLDTMPPDMPIHLEAGTGNEPSFHGLLAALEWAEANPFDREERAHLLASLVEGLAERGAHVVQVEGPRTPVVSFTVPGMPNEDVGEVLEGSYDVICRVGLHCAPKVFACLGEEAGTVRLSMSRFTTREEVDVVLGAIGDMTGCGA